MLAGERQRRILDMLNIQENGTVSVAELARAFGVSKMTVRRDLELLEDLGRLRRIHGGAEIVSSPDRRFVFEARLLLNVEVKRALGKAAASMIRPGDSIFLDAGTTLLEVARNIPRSLIDSGEITVLTRSLLIAAELRSRRQPRLIVLGGTYSYDFDAFGGSLCQNALRAIHVDTVFIGTDGVTLERGLSTDNVSEAVLYGMIARCADRVVLVADSSKIGVHQLQSILSLDDIDVLVTDSGAPSDFVDKLSERRIDVIQVSAKPG